MSRGSTRDGAPRLGRAVLFAALAGLGALPVKLMSWPSHTWLFGLYVLMLPCVALLVLAPTLRRGVLAAAVALALCSPAAVVTPAFGVAALLAVVALGLGRSGISHPRPLLRAIALELTLGVVSLALTAVIHDGRPVGDAFAVWCFWLVQSAFALFPPSPPVRASRQDPFEAAVAAADAVLGHGRASQR